MLCVMSPDAEGRFVVGDGCSYLARELGVKTLIDSVGSRSALFLPAAHVLAIWARANGYS